jgi:hypothetical protein
VVLLVLQFHLPSGGGAFGQTLQGAPAAFMNKRLEELV